MSALHKDSYENIYCQVAGRKRFVLISPFESICVGEQNLQAATYAPSSEPGQFKLVPDDPADIVPFWPTVDPDGEAGPWWDYCSPLHVELNPGDVRIFTCGPDKADLCVHRHSTYLPCGNLSKTPLFTKTKAKSKRYHKVSQTCSPEGLCIAVNYWYIR